MNDVVLPGRGHSRGLTDNGREEVPPISIHGATLFCTRKPVEHVSADKLPLERAPAKVELNRQRRVTPRADPLFPRQTLPSRQTISLWECP